jgi:type IV pilus assembly protein PilF
MRKDVDVVKAVIFILLFFTLNGCVSQESRAEDEMQAKQQKKASALNVQLGLGYLKQGDVQRSKLKLMAALKQDPNSVQAMGAMAYYFEKAGQKKRAKDYYLRALSVSKGSGPQLNNYGAYLCREGKYAEANDYFVRASKEIDYLNTAGALENAGLCSLAMPDAALATLFFKKALEQDPKRFYSLYRLAKIAFDKREYKTTLDYINRYQSGSPLRLQIVWLAYQASIKLGDKKQAGEYAWILKKRFPTSNEYKQLQASNQKHDNSKRKTFRA